MLDACQTTPLERSYIKDTNGHAFSACDVKGQKIQILSLNHMLLRVCSSCMVRVKLLSVKGPLICIEAIELYLLL